VVRFPLAFIVNHRYFQSQWLFCKSVRKGAGYILGNYVNITVSVRRRQYGRGSSSTSGTRNDIPTLLRQPFRVSLSRPLIIHNG
ncbi:hypothetical protein, partial [Klebsiella variicola]